MKRNSRVYITGRADRCCYSRSCVRRAGRTLYLLFWGGPDRVPALLKSIGTQGDGHRVLRFGLPCGAFQQEKQLPALIHAAFAAARKYNVAVMLNFDFHVAWESRPDLWNWFDPSRPGYNPANKDNVEWFGWDGPPGKSDTSTTASLSAWLRRSASRANVSAASGRASCGM